MKRNEFKELINQQVYVTVTMSNGQKLRGNADYISEYTNEAFLLDEYNVEYSFQLEEVIKVEY